MKELDVVKLKDGREATVVEMYEDEIEAEFVEESGKVEMKTIPINDIEKVIWES